MKQGAQGWCTGMTLRDGMGGGGREVQDGEHVHPWLIHVNVWQKPPQYFTVISLQLKFKRKKSLPQPPQKNVPSSESLVHFPI